LRQAQLQKAQEFPGEICIGHGAEMLSMRREQSNQAKFIVAREARQKTRGLTLRLRSGEETAAAE
jgi:hypothetical protein